MLAAGSFLNVDPKTQHNSSEFAEDEGEEVPAQRGTPEVPEESDDMEDDSEEEPNS